jgi:IS30 family transposase
MRGRGLTDEEREEISRGIAAEESGREIALRLGRHYSVINREVARCGGRAGYRSAAAAVLREVRARRPKPHRLAADRRLHDAVAAGLAVSWSPRQISARLRAEHPDDEAMRVSHETIYQTLFCQARGELNTQLKLALRTGRTHRVERGTSRPKQARIAGMVNISERPAEATDRAVPGHWEGDLVRHEALRNRAGVEDLRRCAVAAA